MISREVQSVYNVAAGFEALEGKLALWVRGH